MPGSSLTRACQSDGLGQLQDRPHILSPARPPPLVAELDALPPHPQPRQIPIRPDALQSWARAEPAIDLDPAMDEMREFEIGWRAADGTCGRLVAGRAYDAIESGNNGRKGALVDATPTMSGVDRKGKGRAMDIDMADPCGAVDGDEGEMGRAQAVALPQPNGDSDAPAATAVPAMTISEQSVHTAGSWEEEAKRRKAVWRARICADPGYDSVFSILPLVSSLRIIERGETSCSLGIRGLTSVATLYRSYPSPVRQGRPEHQARSS